MLTVSYRRQQLLEREHSEYESSRGLLNTLPATLRLLPDSLKPKFMQKPMLLDNNG